MMWRALLGAGLALAGSACGATDAEPARLSVARRTVIGGEPSPTSHDGVVILRADPETPQERLCSASLVAPNLVLTARHCVSYLTEAPFRCNLRGEAIDNEDGGGYLGAHVPAQAIEVYGAEKPRDAPLARGRRVMSTLSSTICIDDLAFVVLDRSLDLPILPLRLGRPARVGEVVELIGYGVTDDVEQLSYRAQDRYYRADLSIEDVGSDTVADVTSFPPRSLLLIGPSGCLGDSGGPLLAQETGAILGVYSLLADAACTDPEVRHHFVHVPAFQSLIDDAFAAAEATPALERMSESGAGGEGGASGTSGMSGMSGETGAESEPERDDGSCHVASSPGGNPAALLTLLAAWLIRRSRPRRPSAAATPNARC